MKKLIVFLGLSLIVFLAVGTANAQMMRNGYGVPYGATQTTTASTSQDAGVLAGQQVLANLQSKQVQCSQLTTTDFENLGDYFMDQMMGSAHQAMDQTIISQSGQAGLDAMHVAMGERFSGCNPNAMMQGGWSSPWNNNYGYMPMMGYYGYGYGWNPLGFLWMILWWVIIIIGIIVLVKWLRHGRYHGWRDHGQSAFDILKERYAKGEIDKKEFEEKKKDLQS